MWKGPTPLQPRDQPDWTWGCRFDLMFLVIALQRPIYVLKQVPGVLDKVLPNAVCYCLLDNDNCGRTSKRRRTLSCSSSSAVEKAEADPVVQSRLFPLSEEVVWGDAILLKFIPGAGAGAGHYEPLSTLAPRSGD